MIMFAAILTVILMFTCAAFETMAGRASAQIIYR
jgi:hypothetical protein